MAPVLQIATLCETNLMKLKQKIKKYSNAKSFTPVRDVTLFWDHRGTTGTTTGPRCESNVRANPEYVAWLNISFAIKHPAYRKAGGMISNPRAVGSLRMRL